MIHLQLARSEYFQSFFQRQGRAGLPHRLLTGLVPWATRSLGRLPGAPRAGLGAGLAAGAGGAAVLAATFGAATLSTGAPDPLTANTGRIPVVAVAASVGTSSRKLSSGPLDLGAVTAGSGRAIAAVARSRSRAVTGTIETALNSERT